MADPITVPLLLGPTGAGKSAIAMRLARRLPLEIVSVDSAQIYRGMDIGTAKASAAERAAVPHHLIDIRDPAESYSAATFVTDATAAIDAILSRGRVPLLVGGTMLYAKALIDGLHRLPAADPAIRARLVAEAARDGWPALHRRLASIDPVTAARLQPGDSQRIERALEVHETSGRPLSAWIGADHRTRADDRRYRVFALEPADRALLHTRIGARFRHMLASGLLEEVRRLRSRADLDWSHPSIRCVGYRQLWRHLDGELTLAEATDQAIAATRQLAKRQLTWLRSMPTRTSIDPFDDDAYERIEAALG